MQSKHTVAMDNRKGSKHVIDEVKFAVLSMIIAGMKQKYVAATSNISESTVSKIVEKKSKSKVVVKKKGTKFKLNATALRILGRIKVKNNMKPIHFTVIELREHYGYRIRARTVRIYVYRIGLHNFAAVSKLFLSERHVTDREQ